MQQQGIREDVLTDNQALEKVKIGEVVYMHFSNMTFTL